MDGRTHRYCPFLKFPNTVVLRWETKQIKNYVHSAKHNYHVVDQTIQQVHTFPLTNLLTHTSVLDPCEEMADGTWRALAT